MTVLLDTHFLIWLVLGLKRLAEFPWVDRHRPWGISPRFTVDDIPLATLIRHALGLTWTRDPFDRMLVAHSLARRVPLCTIDPNIRRHHRLVATE